MIAGKKVFNKGNVRAELQWKQEKDIGNINSFLRCAGNLLKKNKNTKKTLRLK